MAAKKKKIAAKKTKAKPKKAAPKKAAPKKKAATKAAPKKKAAAPKKKAAPKKAAPAKAAPKKAAPVAAVPVVVPRSTGPADPTVDLAHAVAALALDKKAEDVVILKVTDLTSYADCFILASAPSERQVQSIARHVGDEMKKAGKAPVGIEGLEQGHWVLVDLGSVVLHVFLASARHYYDLEGFWSDAPRIDVDEARGLEVVKTMAAAHTAANDTSGDDDAGDDGDGAGDDDAARGVTDAG
jgi:ribosome-associated protein